MEYPHTENTSYGRALHASIEKDLIENLLGSPSSDEENYQFFLEYFQGELNKIDEDELDPELIVRLGETAKVLLPKVYDIVADRYKQYEIFDIEKKLFHPFDLEKIEEFFFLFLGYIDLVLKTDNNKYKIVDWKTSNYGWSDRKKINPIYTDQLVMYSIFLSRELNVPIDNFSGEFVLFNADRKCFDFVEVEINEEIAKKVYKKFEDMLLVAFKEKRYPKKVNCKYCACKDFYREKQRDNK